MISQVSQIFSSPTLESLKMTIDMSAAKHTAIASNIANINTPGYRRVDLSDEFTRNFQQALQRIDNGEKMAKVNPMKPGISLDDQQTYARLDGNTVNLERETSELVKNQTDFDFAARMLTMQYQGLKSAITGR